jgi:catechol 2,3-dioxygenase-like lactoylglutathione lyase family enzyme
MGPFLAVALGHGLTIDFADAEGAIRPMHFAFRVSETQFDVSFRWVSELGVPYWADPRRTRPRELAQRGAGRAFYFEDPSGHFFEVLTRPEIQEEAA